MDYFLGCRATRRVIDSFKARTLRGKWAAAMRADKAGKSAGWHGSSPESTRVVGADAELCLAETDLRQFRCAVVYSPRRLESICLTATAIYDFGALSL